MLNCIPIFVYGTLIKDCRNYKKSLEGNIIKTQQATTTGKLFHIENKNYPALLLDGTDTICGQVHWILKEDYERIMKVVNQIEKYVEDTKKENEYNKEFIDVLVDDKTIKIECYIYNPLSKYNKEDKLIYISYGDWLKYLKENNLSCKA